MGSFPAFGYLRPVTVIFCLWAKFSLWLQSARLLSVNTFGRVYSVIKYGLLTMARYGHTTRIRPIDDRPVEGPLFLRPIEGLLFLRPIEGPLFLRPVGGPVSLQ